MMDKIMSIDSGLNWDRLSRRISRSKSLTYKPTTRPTTMPACIPQNNVTDVNANTAEPPGHTGSKLTKIMTCLFWKKKTNVVDMNKDRQAATRKNKMAVDRSERSRRVLKMESMRETPTTREVTEARRPASAASTKMFLPSENPTTSFLSYLNPSVRRACSEVIRSSSEAQSVNKNVKREAFTDEANDTLPKRTRNTNYRGQRAIEKQLENKRNRPKDADKPPKPPERSQSQKITSEYRKPVIVPGTMVCSDEDIGYNSENEISDLHDELRRMKMSQSDLRTISNGDAIVRMNRHRRREGSISLSEGSDSDENETEETRPNNPSPSQHASRNAVNQDESNSKSNLTSTRNESRDLENYRGPKGKIMEEVIDALYMKTQQNIDHIYRNGLDNMQLETFRPDTATPDTCMKVYEENPDIPKVESDNDSPVESHSRNTKNKTTSAAVRNETHHASVTHENNGLGVSNVEDENNEDIYTPQMDTLLTEVSIWAKDRQNWLLEDGRLCEDNAIERQDTNATMKTDDNVIAQITKTNSDKCKEWIHDQNEIDAKRKENNEKRTNGILMGPTLFRTTLKYPTNVRKVSFNKKENSENESKVQLSRNRTYSGAPIDEFSAVDIEVNGQCLAGNTLQGQGQVEGNVEPWTKDMYNTTMKVEDDRSTLNDDLSEFDQKAPYQTRSPDSWLSSVASYSNLTNKQRSHDDSFETVSSHNAGNTPNTYHIKVTADEPAKSHQILRQAPKVHAPFKGEDRERTPMPSDSSYIPVSKPLLRNTQLRPLPAPRPPRTLNILNEEMNSLNAFPALPGMKEEMVLKISRNMTDFEGTSNSAMRPFSEIPLRPSNLDRNQSMSNPRPSTDTWQQAIPTRPVSETMPPKRSDKVGMGNIMATDSTKERNKYARDIVNSFQKQKLQPQEDAFQATSNPDGGNTIKKKRHTVFDNNLIKGGYTYDKHSRTRENKVLDENNTADLREEHILTQNRDISYIGETNNGGEKNTPSPRNRSHINEKHASEYVNYDHRRAMRGEESYASISQLNLDIRESRDVYGRNKMAGYGINNSSPRSPRENLKSMTHLSYPSVEEKLDVNIGGVTNKGLQLAGASKSVQSHSHGAIVGIMDNTGISHTAEKFKNLRTRRDQEIGWLMKDAAETEV